MSRSASSEPVWLFGYGSLIYHIDFPYLERRRAAITGWSRRFWQGSHDHRGLPGAPGRVVTLIPSAQEICVGIALKVTHDVFEHLDHREKNGYQRQATAIEMDGGEVVDGLVYLAPAGNFAWLGEADTTVIAQQIADSRGPSGHNRDYLLNLDRALRALDTHDEHVFELAELVRSYSSLESGS